MSNKIMLDLETLGMKSGAIISSIGAVKFDDDKVLDTFYSRIDPETCAKVGLTMDVSTVMWWLGQDAEARLEITNKGEPLQSVLESFSTWAGSVGEMWGCGSDFDNVILSCAYEKSGLKQPWAFFTNRCYRTVKSIAGKLIPHVKIERIGTYHNALDDATSQANHLIRIRKELKSLIDVD